MLLQGHMEPAPSELFGAWREKGVMRREDLPALYLYGQEFALPTGERERRHRGRA